MSAKKKIVGLLFFAGVLAVVALAGVLAKNETSSARAAQSCGETQPTRANIRFASSQGTSAPQVTLQQAITAAKKTASFSIENASAVNAKYVLFSDDAIGVAQTPGDDNTVVLSYQNVPAWVVTFCGLDIPAVGPRMPQQLRKTRTIPMNHEWNVVINANTGESIEEFTFK